ncbi:TonB-dependent receptor family protein [Tamlana flava]|uniref:TonB-dependent receptor family protein n=1 Tax=Tamlana flava TaxID=3158572 RepID=UPI00351B04AD
MFSIKTCLSFLCLALISTFSIGQNPLTGKVIDKENKLSIPEVLIINLKSNDSVFSNLNGIFEVVPGTFLFKKEGYSPKQIEFKGNTFSLVELQINTSQLNEIVIKVDQIPTKLKKSATAISIISTKDIERSNHINFNSVLNRVPGVFMQSGALNTNRITIRGIGSRNLFGTSKIRAYFKDIPLTNGSGETNIEDFELTSISRMEITKGAVSSIYGAGLGGTINISPKLAFLNESQVNSEFSIGSFGLRKGVLNGSYGSSKNSLGFVYSNTNSDGFRENNNYNRQTITFNSNHFLNAKNSLNFLASYVDLRAFIPSSINETTYLNSPKSADINWKAAQGYEDSQRGIVGLSWNHDFNNKTKQITSVFISFRNAYEPRPFNILKEETLAFGIRTRLLGNIDILNKNLNYTFGGEIFKDNYDYETFENLYSDFPPDTGSVAGNKLSSYSENRHYFNLFFDGNYEISEKTTFSLGLNLNKTGYVLDDQFPASNSNPDQSGSFKFKTIVSPKLGISHIICKSTTVFANASHGFSPISLNETLLPDGQINTNLKPETGWNFELGTRGATLKNRMQYSLSFYRLDIKNLLVPRRTAQDEFIGINAGKTQHDGLEVSLDYQIRTQENFSIGTLISYTLNHFTFKEFVDDTTDYSGNDLTGVPSEIFNMGIDFNSKIGFYGNINFQHVGKMPMTDSNSIYSESYNLTNLKFGFKTNLNKKLKSNVFFGVNNIFDEAYASQILINAPSFGGNAPRYYYPGNPANFYTGINVNYSF